MYSVGYRNQTEVCRVVDMPPTDMFAFHLPLLALDSSWLVGVFSSIKVVGAPINSDSRCVTP